MGIDKKDILVDAAVVAVAAPVVKKAVKKAAKKAAKKAVIMQLDTSNCLDGGADPVEVLKQYPKRSRSVHVKEHGDKGNAIIGEGEVDWESVFKFCEKDVTEVFIVEHERGNDPESCIKYVTGCFQGLKKLGKV